MITITRTILLASALLAGIAAAFPSGDALAWPRGQTGPNTAVTGPTPRSAATSVPTPQSGLASPIGHRGSGPGTPGHSTGPTPIFPYYCWGGRRHRAAPLCRWVRQQHNPCSLDPAYCSGASRGGLRAPLGAQLDG